MTLSTHIRNNVSYAHKNENEEKLSTQNLIALYLQSTGFKCGSIYLNTPLPLTSILVVTQKRTFTHGRVSSVLLEKEEKNSKRTPKGRDPEPRTSEPCVRLLRQRGDW